MLNLFSPAADLGRVGRQVAGQLKHLGIETIQDLLFYFPSRYEDWSHLSLIKDLQPGQTTTVRGQVEIIQNRRSRWRKTILTEAVVRDESGSMAVGWFHQPYLAHILKPGDEIYLSGKIQDAKSGEWQMISPMYEKVQEITLHTARLVPIYSATYRLSQKQIRFLIKQAMTLINRLQEWLPSEILKKYKLMPLKNAVAQVHFPSSLPLAEEARHRFKFEELFLLQVLAQLFRRDLEQSPAPKIAFDEPLTKQFVSSLPFQLTDDQRKAAWEILCDISGQNKKIPLLPPLKKGEAGGFIRPMNRLLEGEVGSGKTIVAALAILNAVKSGYQVAYLAPTEILANQHFETFSKLFEQFGIKVGLLTRSHALQNPPQSPFLKGGGEGGEVFSLSQRESQRGILKKGEVVRDLLKGIKGGGIDLVIGTHALIQEKVKFKNLALAIIDEQHRFGVEQRKALREKSGGEVLPHLLSMTATPIPRTLSLAFFGDLDLSFIRELPMERKKIETYIVCNSQDVIASGAKQSHLIHGIATSPTAPRDDNNIWTREQVYNFVREEIKKNHRIFILCPLIDPSDIFGLRSVKEEAEKLQKEIFTDIPLGILHGRLKGEEKEKLMADFREGKKPILVTTTVIEVGVDVPKATVMLVEGAERFGLAQLHQLRGRIGRGEAQSYCFLMADDVTEKSLARLQVFLTCEDGFALAEKDLNMRGPGEIWGTAQSGFPEFKIASINDLDILKQAQEAAETIISQDPELKKHTFLAQHLRQFFERVNSG